MIVSALLGRFRPDREVSHVDPSARLRELVDASRLLAGPVDRMADRAYERLQARDRDELRCRRGRGRLNGRDLPGLDQGPRLHRVRIEDLDLVRRAGKREVDVGRPVARVERDTAVLDRQAHRLRPRGAALDGRERVRHLVGTDGELGARASRRDDRRQVADKDLAVGEPGQLVGVGGHFPGPVDGTPECSGERLEAGGGDRHDLFPRRAGRGDDRGSLVAPTGCEPDAEPRRDRDCDYRTEANLLKAQRRSHGGTLTMDEGRGRCGLPAPPLLGRESRTLTPENPSFRWGDAGPVEMPTRWSANHSNEGGPLSTCCGACGDRCRSSCRRRHRSRSRWCCCPGPSPRRRRGRAAGTRRRRE